eukprot:gene38791-62357_t
MRFYELTLGVYTIAYMQVNMQAAIKASQVVPAAFAATVARCASKPDALFSDLLKAEQVLGPFDGAIVSHHALKNLQLGTAEILARAGGGANRAMILHQQHTAIIAHFGVRHVAFLVTRPRQRINAALRQLAMRGVVELGYGGVRVVDICLLGAIAEQAACVWSTSACWAR